MIPPEEKAQAWKALEGQYFRHFKGNDYQLLVIARHSETQEPQAVYRALYGEGEVWVRPLAMFLEEIERDGVRVRRFAPIEPGELREQG